MSARCQGGTNASRELLDFFLTLLLQMHVAENGCLILHKERCICKIGEFKKPQPAISIACTSLSLKLASYLQQHDPKQIFFPSWWVELGHLDIGDWHTWRCQGPNYALVRSFSSALIELCKSVWWM